MDEAFVLVSIISGLFTLAGISLWQFNWGRRERMKIEFNFIKQKNSLEFKKLARDYGLSTTVKPQQNALNNPGGLLDIARGLGLSKDQIGDIIDVVAGGPRGAPEIEEEEPENDNLLGSIAEGFLKTEAGQNLLQGAVKGVAQGRQNDQSAQV